MTIDEKSVEKAVVDMYTKHPSPSHRDKLGFVEKRMNLRLYGCGVSESDYVGRKVLDAGCGTGEYSCWFASRGADVIGIDLAEGSLLEAQTYAKEHRIEGVRFERRSVLDTGFPEGSFDLVYCTGVLHHTPDPQRGLAELCRVVRPGGKVLVSFYNKYGFFPREVRRQITRVLGGEDLDRRVAWDRRLFPFTARKLMKGERNDPESALYDYFAIPHESMHSIAQVLGWFDQLGLEYTGTFAPAYLLDYLPLFARKEYGMVEKQLPFGLGRRLGTFGGTRRMRRKRPGYFTGLLAQLTWLAAGIGIFSICGRRRN